MPVMTDGISPIKEEGTIQNVFLSTYDPLFPHFYAMNREEIKMPQK